jgi:hypothetical protein
MPIEKYAGKDCLTVQDHSGQVVCIPVDNLMEDNMRLFGYSMDQLRKIIGEHRRRKREAGENT